MLPLAREADAGWVAAHVSHAPFLNEGIEATTIRTRYVATDGNDTNPGTETAPWRTLVRAAAVAVPGDRIYVRSGTYDPFTMTRSGTSDHPITFVGYPGDATRPVVNGHNAISFVVSLLRVHDVRIQNFAITGGHHAGQDGGGVSVYKSYNVAVVGSILHDNSAYGVQVYDSTATRIRNNDIYGNGEGVDIRHGGAGVQILNNRIHDQDRGIVATPTTVNAHDDTGGIGVAFVWTTGPVLARGNRIWGNRWMSYDYGWDGGGFEIFGASNVTMTGNVLWDSDDILETGTDNGVACANNAFTRNVAYDGNPATRTVGMFLRCATNMLVANNTFSNIDYWIYDIELNSAFYDGAIDGLRIINNINSMNNGKIYALGPGIALATLTIDYNLDYNPGYVVASLPGHVDAATTTQLHSWTGLQAHGVNANPRFVHPGLRDYHLMAGSPAIDCGLVIARWTDGYSGRAPDIGRFER